MTVFLPDEAATIAYAAVLSQQIDLYKHTALYFQGEIGAGKTTLIRALLRGLSVKDTIKSPTFSMLESYDVDGFLIHHFDLYRLTQPEELIYLDWQSCFSGKSLCCVEWPERAERYLPIPHKLITLSLPPRGQAGRLLTLT